MSRNIYKKYLYCCISILLICLSLTDNLKAQNYTYNLRQFGDEFVDLVKQPSNWQTKDWLTFAGIAGGTFALMHVDEGIRTIVKSDRSYMTCLPLVITDKYGEGWGQLIFGTSFLVAGILQDNNANQRLGFEVLQSFTYSLTITGVLKLALGRARPFMNEGSSSYHPFQLKTRDYFSLPSGHATNAFSFSTLLAAQSDNLLIKIAAFTPAVFTALARVYYDRHWTSDVLLGAAIGYFVGKYVTKLHDNKDKKILDSSPSQNQIGFIISF